MLDNIDHDLPWDGLWEYVLGEAEYDCDDDMSRQRTSSFPHQRSDASDDWMDFLVEDTLLPIVGTESSIAPKEMTRQSSESSAAGKPEMRRRLSFTRQVSGQSTSTAGSNNSSGRRKGFFRRRRSDDIRTEMDNETPLQADFLAVMSVGVSEDDTKEVKSSLGKRATKSTKSTQSKDFSGAITPVYEDRDDNPKELAVSATPREPCIRIPQKHGRSDVSESQSSSGFMGIGSKIDASKTHESSPKTKTKRKVFWKKDGDKESTESRNDESFMAAITSGYDGAEVKSKETASPKTQRKRFWKKSTDVFDRPSGVDIIPARYSSDYDESESEASSDNFLSSKLQDRTPLPSRSSNVIHSFASDNTQDEGEAPGVGLSTKREKRKLFGKKKDRNNSLQSLDVLAVLSASSDGDGNESREIVIAPEKKDKRKPFWRRRSAKSSHFGNDEDKSDLESIEAMLGPWDGGRQEAERKSSSLTKSSRQISEKGNAEDSPNREKVKISTQKQALKSALKQSPKQLAEPTASMDTHSVDSGTWSKRKTVNQTTKSASETMKAIRCGHKTETEEMSFQSNPVVLSSNSEDTTSNDAEKKKVRSILKGKSGSSDDDRALLNLGSDDQTGSFLPSSLMVPWKNEIQSTPVHKCSSTDSAKSSLSPNFLNKTPSSISATSLSINSSLSGSEKAQGSKKIFQRVKWADEVKPPHRQAPQGVSFAQLRKVLDPAWLYAVSSSDSDSSMTSSANPSVQSEELSSVQTDSETSVSAVSSGDKGESEREVEIFGQLPPIDENASYRESLGADCETNIKASPKIIPGPKNAFQKDEEAVQKTISVIHKQNGSKDEMTKIEPQVGKSSTFSNSGSGKNLQNAMLLTEGSSRKEIKVEETKQSVENERISKNITDCSLDFRRRGFEPRLPICKLFKNLTDDDIVRAMESGIPVHELTYEELAEIFPKIRMVADNSLPDQGSLVLGNANSFDNSRPALFQVSSKAMKPATGLQSLYEYDYTSGKHMSVSYDSCGIDPKASLKVLLHEKPPESSEPNFAVIQVEASTISRTDCRTRRDGWFGNKRVIVPNTPGVDIVGKIYRIDYESSRNSGLRKGDKVISLVSQGGNARFITVATSSLIKIPEKIDPAEAASLVETYMTAFQALHYNQSILTRYRKTSLHGKSILIIGGMSATMTRAMSQLAQLAGANTIFATARKKDFKMLSQSGILPLSTDPVTWWEQLAGAIDILISLDEEVIPLHYKLLKLDGIVIVSASEFHEDLMMYQDDTRDLRTKLACSTAKSQTASRTIHYDLFDEWETNKTRAKKDLAHLVDLLDKRRIVPTIVDRVPLAKVADVQQILEKRRAKGHFVCEPWLLSKSRAVSL